jgi:IS605 OrfB family transposase
MRTLIKVRKIQIIPVENFNETYSFIREMMSKTCEISNAVMRESFYLIKEMKEIKTEQNVSFKELDAIIRGKYGLTSNSLIYDRVKALKDIPSASKAIICQNIYSKLNKNFYEVYTNKISLPSFTKDKMPLPFRGDNISLMLDGDDYYINIYKHKFKFNFGRDRSNNKLIVDKLYSNEYKFCTSSIIIKDKKIFLHLSFKFDVTDEVVYDKNKILGIDLGINRPVAQSTNYNKYTPQIEIGGKIHETRMSIYRQRRSLQSALKYAQGGRGRKTKMSRMDKLGNYEHNFMKTMNDLLSRKIIDYCLSEGIGTIHMEDLTGITMDKNNYFLKSWSYYQLQLMISYKAQEHNITVLYVNPAYTSQTCSCCGNIDKEQRKSIKFICSNEKCEEYQIEKDSDINASKNITMKEGYNKDEKKKLNKEKKKKLEKSE